jgi:hypothetical protein
MEINLDLNNKVEVAKAEPRPLLQHKEGNDYVLQIDNSSMEVFNTCPRAAFYSKIVGRTKKESPALVYGSAIHEGLEYYYKNGRSKDSWEADMLTAALGVFEDKAQDFHLDEWRTADMLCHALQKYVRKYAKEEVKPLQLDTGPAVEIRFSQPLGVVEFGSRVPVELLDNADEHTDDVAKVDNVHVYWIGKIDVIVEDSGGLFVMDHKTTQRVGNEFWNDFYLSNQMLGYAWATQKFLGEPVKGLILNAIIGRRPTKTGTSLDFQRQKYWYTQEQISNWEINALALVSDFLGDVHRDYFPMKTAWCTKFGKCQYHDVCTLPESSRLHMLFSTQYQDNVWSPLED